MTATPPPREPARLDPDNDPLGPDFETAAEARAEDALRARRARARLMQLEGPDHLREAADVRYYLEAVDLEPDERPFLSLASSRSMRWTRQKVLSALHRAFAPYHSSELATATVIKHTWLIPAADLARTKATAIKNQFRTDLNDIGLTTMPGPFIAILHGEFDPVSERFTLHWHVLTTRPKAEGLKRLVTKKRNYVETPSGAPPIVVKPVRDRTRQFSYILKSYWPSRGIRMVADARKRDRRKRRIGEPFGTSYLIWLDRYRLQDLIVMTDTWSRRRGGSAEMRALVQAIEAPWRSKRTSLRGAGGRSLPSRGRSGPTKGRSLSALGRSPRGVMQHCTAPSTT